jgi:hypothetical protein
MYLLLWPMSITVSEDSPTFLQMLMIHLGVVCIILLCTEGCKQFPFFGNVYVLKQLLKLASLSVQMNRLK